MRGKLKIKWVVKCPLNGYVLPTISQQPGEFNGRQGQLCNFLFFLLQLFIIGVSFHSKGKWNELYLRYQEVQEVLTYDEILHITK